jgi:hypothetical protein
MAACKEKQHCLNGLLLLTGSEVGPGVLEFLRKAAIPLKVDPVNWPQFIRVVREVLFRIHGGFGRQSGTATMRMDTACPSLSRLFMPLPLPGQWEIRKLAL